MQGRLYLLQRYSAILLVPLVVAHLLAVLYARYAGLGSDQILALSDGHIGWLVFYAFFVLVVGVHAPIGLWNVLRVLPGLPAWLGAILRLVFAGSVLGLGLGAVAGLLR